MLGVAKAIGFFLFFLGGKWGFWHISVREAGIFVVFFRLDSEKIRALFWGRSRSPSSFSEKKNVNNIPEKTQELGFSFFQAPGKIKTKTNFLLEVGRCRTVPNWKNKNQLPLDVVGVLVCFWILNKGGRSLWKWWKWSFEDSPLFRIVENDEFAGLQQKNAPLYNWWIPTCLNPSRLFLWKWWSPPWYYWCN